MKVVAFNGSPRKNGNTSILINYVFAELGKYGISTELVHIGGKKLRGCKACMKCFEVRNQRCVIDKDDMNEWIEKIAEADGVILGSPTYFANVTPEMKALIDRAGYVAIANGGILKHKVGAAVVAVRRAGSIAVFDALNHFFLINQMIVPGSRYWNLGAGLAEGDVRDDGEGIKTMQVLGENMAWLLKKLA